MNILAKKSSNACAEDRMDALVCERYGSPSALKFVQLPRPEPKRGDVLIRVMASTITSGDRRIRSLDMPTGFRNLGRLALGWNGPRNPILGAAFAGVVQAVGSHSNGFKVGDAVFGFSGFRMGGHAEYLCMSEKGAIAHKPQFLSFEEAAALPFGGGTALFFLKRAGLRPNETILINGASGNVGMAAVQLACDLGSAVTGVCSSAHFAKVRSLGATQMIDYQKEDFTDTSHRFDVVLDVACNHTVERCLNVLKPGGRLVRLQAGLPEILKSLLLPRRAGRHVIVGTAEEKADHLKHLADLVSQGRYRPVISRVFLFQDAIHAHRYADVGELGGSVVIRMGSVAGKAELSQQHGAFKN